MKQHTSKAIIYDDSCPLCTAYTKAFVKTGFIEKERRLHFSNITPGLLSIIDINRSKNEIPLIDLTTKQVWYGTDALLEILGQKCPPIKKAGRKAAVAWCLQRLYKLISFNRRVITATENKEGKFNCTPTFNYKYRFLFMVMSLLFTTVMIVPFYKQLLVYVLPAWLDGKQLLIAWSGLSGIAILTAFLLRKQKVFNFLGQLCMLALLVTLLMLPLYSINSLLQFTNTNITFFYLGATTVFITREYIRRMKFAKMQPRK